MPKLCTAGKADEAFIKKLIEVVRDVTSWDNTKTKKLGEKREPETAQDMAIRIYS